ncbi:hypothetical protein P3L10_011049 [Capsicum annuum]
MKNSINFQLVPILFIFFLLHHPTFLILANSDETTHSFLVKVHNDMKTEVSLKCLVNGRDMRLHPVFSGILEGVMVESAFGILRMMVSILVNQFYNLLGM